MGISSGNSCHCKAEKADTSSSIFTPLKGKMKVLKKIKRRMGLVSRSTSGTSGTNNLPPLHFHQVHGDNIRISRDGTVARRVESFCKGITFSARPVRINERVYIKFTEISTNWSGVIRFGFTFNDPSTLRCGLPKYACPDLTNKPGYWAKALAERFCERDTVLFYYVTAAGDVHFGINGEEKGIFFSGVETRGPLWALVDVYGNSTAVELVDVRHQLNNVRRAMAASCEHSPDDVDRLIVPSLQALSVAEGEELPPLRYQPTTGVPPIPLFLHRTRGRNVRLSHGRHVASRTDTEFSQGYVFTARPLAFNERLIIQVLATEPMYVGSLALGLTSCDPAYLQPGDLPDDADLLLDRPEYWVVSKDFASNPQRGDEISVCVTHNGEVQISKNGRPSQVVMHVDQTLKLWAFLDIYGSTQRIRVLSSPAIVSPVRHPDRRMLAASNSESMNSINSQSEMRRNSVIQHAVTPQQPARVCCVSPGDMLQVQPTINGGAVLVVNLPAAHANLLNHQQQALPPVTTAAPVAGALPSVHTHTAAAVVQPPPGPPPIPQHHSGSNGYAATPASSAHHHHPHHRQSPPPPPPPPAVVAPAPVPIQATGTMMSNCSNTYIEPVSGSAYSTLKSWSEAGGAVGTGNGVECTICYENTIDSVLYMCGHMCMCYECAIQQWKGKGGGHCPLCRAVIRDVIRTYKS